MAREISPVCDFIFGSICMSLLTDMVDVELMTRTVEGIYTCRKDHRAESIMFSPWSRTITPFPLLCRKIQAFQSKSRQAMAWDYSNAMSYFSTPPTPKHYHRKCAPGKTRTRQSNQRQRFNPIKTDMFNACDIDSSDWNKLDMIQPTPKRLSNRSPKDCTYCAYNALHPSPAPSVWSSEDWDGDKAKVREQRSLIDFKLVDAQVQDTTPETTIDI